MVRFICDHIVFHGDIEKVKITKMIECVSCVKKKYITYLNEINKYSEIPYKEKEIESDLDV